MVQIRATGCGVERGVCVACVCVACVCVACVCMACSAGRLNPKPLTLVGCVTAAACFLPRPSRPHVASPQVNNWPETHTPREAGV